MTATEALTYCLGCVDPTPEDGEFHSRAAYDRDGRPHWIAWLAEDGDRAAPKLCGECPTPFAAACGPYRASREQPEECR